jgi:hypothetical protein
MTIDSGSGVKFDNSVDPAGKDGFNWGALPHQIHNNNLKRASQPKCKSKNEHHDNTSTFYNRSYPDLALFAFLFLHA